MRLKKLSNTLIQKILIGSVINFVYVHALYAQSESNVVVNPIPTISNDWRFSVTAAAWVPASWTSSYIGNRYVGSYDLTVGQSLQSAGGIAMFSGEAHKGNWGVAADLVYWQINNGTSNENYVRGSTSISAGTSGTTTQTILTGAGTYTIYKNSSWYVDALAGARYITSTTSAQANYVITRTVLGVTRTRTNTFYPSATQEATDPIVGIKGRARIFDSSWYLPFYVDAGKGFGPNNKTWQAMAGIGKGFSWGDINLQYRAMYFDLSSSNTLTKSTNAGPQIAATINF